MILDFCVYVHTQQSTFQLAFCRLESKEAHPFCLGIFMIELDAPHQPTGLAFGNLPYMLSSGLSLSPFLTQTYLDATLQNSILCYLRYKF